MKIYGTFGGLVQNYTNYWYKTILTTGTELY